MKVKNRRKRFFAIRSFRKDAHKKIFSMQDYMDFAIVDSVLHFNDGKRVHTGIFNQMGLDVGIHSHIYCWRTTPEGYLPTLKRTRKSKKKVRQSKIVQRKDQEDNYKLGRQI